MLLRILGIALVVWIAFSVIGWLAHAFVVMLVIGAVLFVGSAAWAGLRKRNRGELR